MMELNLTEFAIDSITATALYTMAFMAGGCMFIVLGKALFNKKDNKRIEG